MSKILIYRLGAIGDLGVMIPFLLALKSYKSPKEIFLLTNNFKGKFSIVNDLLINTGLIDDFLLYENNQDLVKKSFFLQGFDMIYVMNGPKFSSRRKLRDKSFFKLFFPTSKVIYLNQNIDKPESYRILNIITTQHFYFRFEGISVIDRPIRIGISPSSKMQSKTWPKEYFVKLLDMIYAKNNDIEFVFFGKGDVDEKIVEYIMTNIINKRVLNYCNKLDLYNTFREIGTCKYFISNDSGLMHLASILGVSTFNIFSSRDIPIIWEPYGEQRHVVLRSNPPCSNCMLETCSHIKCLKAITPESAFPQFITNFYI